MFSRDGRRPIRLLLTGALAAMVLMLLAAAGASANASSQNVAMVPDPGGAFNNGGDLPTAGFPNGYAPSFTNVSPDTIADGTVANPIAGFDTVVLAQLCNIGTYLNDPDFKSRIEGFVQNGGKLLIWDSECTSTDYSNFVFPFQTDNPGANGAEEGTLTDLEDNSLGSSNPSSPFFIDYGLVATDTDGVGDSNVFTSFDAHYCADNRATNSNGVNGPVQVYAPLGNGLIIYNGLDYDDLDPTQSFDASSTSGQDHLGRIWLFNLLEPWNPMPASLPCGKKVFGLALSPKTDSGDVGTEQTLTANLVNNAAPEVNSPITFTVTDGPNKGATGTANTDANGNASFTYRGTGGPGTDTIEARGSVQPPAPPEVPEKQAAAPITVTDTATMTWKAVVPLVPAQKCKDVRKFKFLLHHGPRSTVVKVQVYLNGKLIKTVKGRHLKSVTIKVLPQKDWTVRIVSTHSNGSKLVSVRKYHECTKTKPKTTAHKHRKHTRRS